jgi:hypothetical protein
MASGNSLFGFLPAGAQLPTGNFPQRAYFDAATGVREVLAFIGSGGSADEAAMFAGIWPSYYAGGGVDIVLDYSTDGTSTGTVQWETSFEVLQDQDDQDAGGQGFGTVTDITDIPSSATANVLDRTAAVSVSHSDCGSPAVGDRMRLKIARDHDHETNTDDAQLHSIHITET